MLGALVTEAKVIVDKIQLQIQILSLNVTNIKEQDDKESTCSAEDLGSIPGLGRYPGGGYG